MKRLAILLVLYSTSALAQDQTATEPPVVETTMGDDSSIQVNLDFDFPLYGQLFNTSWMYDNGIISFLQPGSPGAISPWQWSASPINQTPGNYFIAPLWADIAPTSITRYKYQGDSTFMKYTWSNIAEYYSAWSQSPRYSSFSTTIKPDGSITTNYYSVNLQTSNISAGVVGNASLGEYDAKFYAPYGTVITSIPDWTSGGGYAPPPPPPPEPPPYVPPADPVIEQPIIESTPVVQETAPIEEVVQVSTPVLVPAQEPAQELVVAEEPVVEVAAVIEQTTSAETIEATGSTTVDKKVVNIDAKAIAKSNQEALASLTESVVSGSIQSSLEAGAASASGSITALLSTSISGDLSSSNNIAGGPGSSSNSTISGSDNSASLSNTDIVSSIADIGGSVGTTQVVSGGNEQLSFNSDTSGQSDSQNNSAAISQVSPVSQQSTQQTTYSTQNEDSQIEIVSIAPSSQSFGEQSSYSTTLYIGGPTQDLLPDNSNFNTQEESASMTMGVETQQSSIADETNPVSVRSLADMTTTRPSFTEEEERKPEIDDLVSAQDPALAELASTGVQMATLQVVPVGYFSYLNLVYKDRSFYPERRIYRKQRVVDNQRVLRMLNARSDLTYDKMVKEQYSLNDITGTMD